MAAKRLIYMASVVLLMNGLVSISVPQDACAGPGCQNQTFCLNEDKACVEYDPSEWDTICDAVCPSFGGQGCCSVPFPRCQDNCVDDTAELRCRCQRPCP